jgi:hypothetical protein
MLLNGKEKGISTVKINRKKVLSPDNIIFLRTIEDEIHKEDLCLIMEFGTQSEKREAVEKKNIWKMTMGKARRRSRQW